VRRLVALDVEADQLAARSRLPLGEQRAPAREMALVEVHQPARPSSSGERSRPVRIVCSAETKSTLGSMNPASMRAMLSACEPMARMPRERPAAISASQTLGRRRLHPQLIAQIAGKAGARDRQGRRRPS
jgi:hypothetical protein